jgi:hypothetical protein
LDEEGSTSLDPHKAGPFWQQMAMGLLKGAMQGVRDSQRETARRGLYEAEAKMRQARQERTSLEAELDQEQRASS